LICSMPSKEAEVMPSTEPTQLDAVFGSGGDKNKMRNGSLYNCLLEEHFEAYHALPTKLKKQFTYDSIVSAVRREGGRFLEKKKGCAGTTNVWVELTNDKTIVSKIMQAFRDRRRKRVIDTSEECVSDSDEPSELEDRIARLESQVMFLECENKMLKAKFECVMHDIVQF
jgi:hypothetical protein